MIQVLCAADVNTAHGGLTGGGRRIFEIIIVSFERRACRLIVNHHSCPALRCLRELLAGSAAVCMVVWWCLKLGRLRTRKKKRVRAHVGRPTVHNRERVVYAVQMLITIQLIGGFRLLFEMYYSRFE